VDADAILAELEGYPTKAEQMSFEQLLAHDEDTPSPTRPANGQAEPSALVSGRHQDVRLYVTVLLKTFVEMSDAGLVRDAPFQVRLDDSTLYRPDIAFVANASLDRVHETYIEGPPDIIVEIATPETTAADRGDKFVAYEAGGVREYWLIDPVRELANIYHLGPDGYYDEFRTDTAGRLRSRVLRGFILEVDRLWRRVLPTTAETLGMVERMMSQ
jgi:Uma2 family endonuclease